MCVCGVCVCVCVCLCVCVRVCVPVVCGHARCVGLWEGVRCVDVMCVDARCMGVVLCVDRPGVCACVCVCARCVWTCQVCRSLESGMVCGCHVWRC